MIKFKGLSLNPEVFLFQSFNFILAYSPNSQFYKNIKIIKFTIELDPYWAESDLLEKNFQRYKLSQYIL